LQAGDQNRDRFAVLDGMRGVAAIFVIVVHLPFEKAPQTFPGGYLAVDLFFLLSGFVIAHSYGERLRSGMTLREFMLQRLIRLYPLYLLGMVLALIAVQPEMGSRPSKTWSNLIIDTVAGLFFLPTPIHYSVRASGAFLNYASWSLFYELIANILFALVVPHLTPRRLGIIIAAGAAMMAVAVVHTSTLDLGVVLTKSDLLGATGRVTFSFFGGVAIYRLWQSGRLHSLRVPSWLTFIALAIAISLPRSGSWHGAVALLCAWTILPALVFAGARATTGPKLLRVCTNLGAASYAFYILQAPIIDLLKYISIKFAGMPLSALGWLGAALVIVLVYIVALAADAIFDIPVRKWLRARAQHIIRPRTAVGRSTT
jgi:peptidoglycan/LPS O-acetylase OafA/YrhL